MRKLLLLWISVIALKLCFAQPNTWIQKANFGGTERGYASSFSIGTKGYIGMGVQGGTIYNDFWEYDPSNNIWAQKAPYPGGQVFGAAGFSIGLKGYILDFNNQFYEYDPGTNIWTLKAPFPGASRAYGVGFSIGSKGYIGTGLSGISDITLNDFWEYDPSLNKWTQKASVPGTTRYIAVGFSIGSKGYVGTGQAQYPSGNYLNDFYEYDPNLNTWVSKAPLPSLRGSAVGLSITTKGYIGTGTNSGSGSSNNFYEYNPNLNSWIVKAAFPQLRTWATGFSIGVKGYIGTGLTGSSTFFKDFYEYTPDISAPTDYYRSVASGNWNSRATWESTSDNINWYPATLTPDFNANIITVRNGHTVTVTADVSTDQTIVDAGGIVNVNGGNLNVVDGAGFDITVDGAVNITNPYLLSIKSTAAGTASVGPSTGTVTGDVSVERYIPDDGHRAWRLLSVPVNTTKTIKETWQENGANISNFGTLITSPLYNGTNGFDMSSNSSSILLHNQGGLAGPSWTGLTSTNIPLSTQPGYMLFIRGDRNSTPSNNLRNPTVLRSIGTLRMGRQNTPLISATEPGYTLIGNPYAATLDIESFFGGGFISSSFYIWDANLGGLYGVGGYRLVERTAPGVYRQTPQPMGGPASGPTVPDNSLRYIHSSQAFFLRATSGDVTANFGENLKSPAVPSYNPFREMDDEQPQITANLISIAADNIAAVMDGIRVRFDNSYSSSVTSEDVIKISNFSENLGLRRERQMLIVEKLPATYADTIFLNLSNVTGKNYQLEIGGSNLPASASAYLVDKYRGTQTLIDFSAVQYVNFSVNADAASFAADRFMIVFKPNATLPITSTSVKASQQGNNIAVEWKVQNEIGIKNYEVEKSVDGKTFSKVGTTPATGNNMSIANYNWTDVNAVTGNNYYRIRSTSLTGQVSYGSVVKIMIGKGAGSFQVYPNPIAGNVIDFQLTNQPKGTYNLRLTNILGQTTLTRQITHDEGSSAETIQLPANIVKGNYTLEITAPDKAVHSIKIIY